MLDIKTYNVKAREKTVNEGCRTKEKECKRRIFLSY